MKNRRFTLATLLSGLLIVSLGVPVASAKRPAKRTLAGYTVLQVENFQVEENSATEGFPRGMHATLQENTVLRLRKEKLFGRILDAAEPDSTQADGNPESPEPEKRLVLSSTVIKYTKGSRAGRWLVGFGAGATKVKVRFVFRDASTGEELFRTDRQGKFYGTFSVIGGGKGHAVSEASGDVVDGLIRQIRKNI